MSEDQNRTWDALLGLPTQTGAVHLSGLQAGRRSYCPATQAPGLRDKSAIAGGLAGDTRWTLGDHKEQTLRDPRAANA